MTEKPKQTVDLLIEGGMVLTMDAGRRIYHPGYVAVRDGKIAGVGSSASPAYQPKERLDASGMLVMPGLVNIHNHLDQSLYRSCFDRPQPDESLSFWHMALGLTRAASPGRRQPVPAGPGYTMA